MSTAVVLPNFLAMQVAANLIFRYAGAEPSRWLIFFIIGYVIGASSICLMMKLYERLNDNITTALGGGTTFLLVQLALAVTFHSRLSPLQWGRIVRGHRNGMDCAGYG